MIDVHTHIAAFPNGSNGCFMSKAFQKGVLVKLVKWKLGLKGNSADELNRSYVDRLIADLRESKHISKAVVLALDGVYDKDGYLDEDKTHMMIGNDYVKGIVDTYPKEFLFGASVNPQRRDALDELARVIENGARLIKVLPPSQVFDPMDKRYQSFYRLLADKQVPLLCHIGYEFSVTAGKQEYGFPNRLLMALDEGVNVIGAHACSSAIFVQGKFFAMMMELVNKYENFFMDVSALTLPNRAAMAFRLKERPDVMERLVFGSDYPLSAYATPFLGRLGIKDQFKLWRTKNIFDKQAMVLDRVGVKTNQALANKLLRIPS